ncbi:MAG: class I SAM-dependent methyltransferase [Magnetococcales bacterium]|nr:class I SAM-dependent methyltransferase [Magnetococcales bacterium]NGZ04962.1 class I SAM-dependent methyltransferase [Magnetococcales bacterium]
MITDVPPPRQIGEFPDWEHRYLEQPVHNLPWFTTEPDRDLHRTITERGLTKGRFLDVGTGPGTQAAWLAEQGFEVTGSDLAPAAIAAAREFCQQRGLSVTLIVDDILNTTLHPPFDWIFDRGCFHVLPPERRADYVRTIHHLLHPHGLLLLKCFHVKETTMEGGPYRFDPAQIEQLFAESFQILENRETFFEGTLSHQPIALFTVLTPRIKP